MSPAGRVLIVDDDESIRQVVSLFLTDEGYQAETAAHGQAALEVARRAPPSLILLDMRMPVMDGWEFARAYRALPGPHAPIVAFVAALDAGDDAAAIDAAAVLAKPFELEELLRVVRRYARSSSDQAVC